MYAFTIITVLAAMATAQIATPSDPNSVAVEVKNDANSVLTPFPFNPGPLTREIDPTSANAVTLAVGANIDPTFRCQVFDTAGAIVRLNRGNNICKSTFSGGLPWTPSAGKEVVIGSIRCPVAAPDGE